MDRTRKARFVWWLKFVANQDRLSERLAKSGYTAVEYARFADDIVVLVDAHPRHAWLKKAVPKRLRQELTKLEVTVNEEKSKTVDMAQGESFGFLGFDFRRVRSLAGKWRPSTRPSSKSERRCLSGCGKSFAAINHNQYVG